MELNRLFDTIEGARATANWRTAFGEPQLVGDNTIIPVARVTYGFGLGFGQGTGPSDEEEGLQTEGEGGGGGSGAVSKPLGVIVVTPEHVFFEESVDATRVALAAFAMGALFILQLAKTLRAIFGRD